jgi:hypothetical protein
MGQEGLPRGMTPNPVGLAIFPIWLFFWLSAPLPLRHAFVAALSSDKESAVKLLKGNLISSTVWRWCAGP